MNRTSIRTRLRTAFLTLIVAPLTILGAILVWQSYIVQRAQTLQLQREGMDRVVNQIENDIHNLEDDLKLAAMVNNITAQDRKTQAKTLSMLLSHENMHHEDVFNELALLDFTGKVRARVSRVSVYTEADFGERSNAEEFTIPKDSGKIYYSPVHFERETGEPYVIMGMPLIDVQSGSVKNVLVAEIRLRNIWDLISHLHIGRKSSAYITESHGMIVAHSNPSLVLKGTRFRIPERSGIHTGLLGTKAFIDSRQMLFGNQTFYIVTERPLSEALTLTIRIAIIIGILFAGGIAGSIILGLLVRRQVVRPIESLAGTACMISAGDLSQKADYSGEDEFGILAATFNAMTTKLRETIDSLKQSVDERDAAYFKLTERTDELLKANELLRKERNLSRAMISSLPGIFYLFTDKGRLLRWNKNAEEILGYSSEEIAAKNAIDFFIEKDKTLVAERIEEVFLKGSSFVEAHLQTRDGRKLPYLLTGIRYLMDGVPCVIGLGLDISGIKQAEEKFKKQNEMLNNVLNSLTHPFYVIDADNYTIKLANSAAGFGALTGEATCYALTHRSDKPCEDEKHPCVIKKIKEKGIPVTVEHIHHDKQGSPIINEVHGYPIFDHKGNIVQVIEYNLDITDRKRIEEELSRHREHLQDLVTERTAELIKANEQLQKEIMEHKLAEKRKAELLKEVESVNQELKDFAYVVSHDLKAPLRAISTLANWISTDYKEKLDEEGQQQLDLMIKRVKRMHALINGILEYSRVGRVREKKVEVNINELLKEVQEMIVPPDNITVTVENELPTIVCEKTRIMEVFQNLLSNAIKFMNKPAGIIRIGSTDEGGFWKFSVSDNGPGIEREYFDKIFLMFQTLSTAEGRESTGVGLTLVKKIITMYGGKVWVESEIGQGSTFFFTLPKKMENISEPG
jgi:PAS domain S-box-containing protein